MFRLLFYNVGEFARVVELGATTDLKTANEYVEISRTNATCNGSPGVEMRGTWVGEAGVRYARRACAFLRGGHGFMFSYSVPEQDAAVREAGLRTIVEATEFRP